MNKEEFLKRIAWWGEKGEYQRIIDAILALPEESVDDDIMVQLATAYNSAGDFKKAIAVLEGLRARQENSWRWQYCLGYALVHAADDEECDSDSALRETILERARTCFSRCMVLDPPEDCLEDCDEYIQTIEDELFGDEECDEDNGGVFYDDDDADALEEHIREHFGCFPSVYREFSAPDIYIDICVIPPSESRRYYTLVTLGMGSHEMDIPQQYADQPARIELFMRLPAEWKVGESTEEWNWPLILLKNLGRLPISCDTWLGRFHTVDNRETFADNTRLSATLILEPDCLSEQARSCTLPSGDTVEFLEVVPLYREEMQFKVDASGEELLNRLGGKAFDRIVDIDRPSAVPQDYEPEQAGFWDSILDKGSAHAAAIRDKNLPVDKLNALSHMAIFLRWCIENDLCSEDLTERFPEVVDGVKNGTQTDLRDFLRRRYDSALFSTLIADDYRDFAESYYTFGSEGYPHDVDECAEEYFGKELCDGPQFKDEPYLFMPFGEAYYTKLAAKITRAYVRYELRTNEFSRSRYFDQASGRFFGAEFAAIDSETAAKIYALLCAQKDRQTVPFLIVDGTDAAFGDMRGFAENIDNALACAAEYPAPSFEAAAEALTAGFTRDAEPAPQELCDACARYAAKYGARPLVLCSDPAFVTRIYIPCANGYYSVSKPPAELLRSTAFRELLLSRLSTGIGVYFPLEKAEKLFGCPCVTLGATQIKTAAQIISRAKECVKDPQTLLPVYFCDCQTKQPNSRLEQALKSHSPLVIAQLPEKSALNGVVRTLVREELPPVPCPKTAERCESAFGMLPAVVTRVSHSSDTMLFIPRALGENGVKSYIPVRLYAELTEYARVDELGALAAEKLGCECSYIGIMRGEQAFVSAYSRVLAEGNAQGYTPLLIKASPEMQAFLAEGETSGSADDSFDDRLRGLLSSPEASGDIPQGVPLTKFVTIKSSSGGVSPLLLAKLPPEKTAHCLALLGMFGGADERDISRMLGLWREKYGAVPALLGTEALEFSVARPARREDVRELVAQMLALCKNLRAITGFGELAASLAGSTVWFFCR